MDQRRAAPEHLPRALLPILMLAAWCLASAHGVIRPLFQVSDELNYLHAVQTRALASASPNDRACIAPPDGATLTFPALGGKFGFQALAAQLLSASCGVGLGRAAIPVTRVLLGLTFPLLLLTVWLTARRVAPETPDAAVVAALLTLGQPVLATFSGAIAPDGLANLCAAVTFLAATALLQGGQAAWLAALGAGAALGAASKDSALFLGPLALAVTGAWALEGRWPRRLGVAAVTGLGAIAVLGSGLLAQLSTPFPNLGVVLSGAAASPASFLAVVAAAYIEHGAVVLRSGFGGLSNFGGGTLQLAPSLVLIQAALLVGGLAALGWRVLFDGARPISGFVVLLVAALFLALIQVPVRQMMTGSPGPIQGRWLFPVWPLLAVGSGLGWARALPRQGRLLPLFALAASTVGATALLQVVGYYYDAWPTAYRWPHVFLHAAEGYEAGLDVARAMATAATVPGWWRASLLVASLATLAAAVLATSAVPPPRRPTERSHDRHADHR